MQKYFSLLLAAVLFQTICYGQAVDRVEGSPFKATMAPDVLYLTDRSMSESEQYAVGSLAGILARTKPMILQWQYFHQEIVRESYLGINIIETYRNDFAGLLNLFANRLDGYILCETNNASAHVAASLSGILNAVAIPVDLENVAKAAGLTKKLDVIGKDEAWALAEYNDVLNKNVAFFLDYGDWIGLTDYAAYTGGLRYFDPEVDGVLAQSVYDFLNPGALFYGWWVSEDASVGKLSEKSFKMIPSGGLKNLSVFTNIDVPIARQKNVLQPFKAEADVHTVCFVLTDGDHIGWLFGAGYWDQVIWKSDNQSYMNMGYTVSPNLTELTPLVYNDLINGLQTTPEGRNVAVASPSGLGYFFPSKSPNLSFHTTQLNEYMRKADMSIVNVIDNDDGAHIPNEYLKQSNIDALFYYTYGAQYQGMNGKISWYKDKPSIGGRFVLWGHSEDNSPETQERVRQDLANVLNAQSTNIYSEQGYSLVPVHVWTMKPHDVLDVISKLGANVRVVAPDEFVWLIRKNVGGLLMGDGMGLKGEYYSGSSFNTLVNTKIDKKLDFNKSTNSYFRSMGNDPFSVRWTGKIQPLYSEEYSFYMDVNGGAKLIINGSTLIDAPSDNGATVLSGNISLTAGEKYDIIIEYRQETDMARCAFEWESESQLRQYVPFTQLYAEPVASTGPVTVYQDLNLEGFCAGLKIGAYNAEKLSALGMPLKDISSLKVKEGYKAIVFSEDNFLGESLVINENSASLSLTLMDDNISTWNDNIASVKIMANGDASLEGAYFLRNSSSHLYLDVSGGEFNYNKGANVQQFSYLGKNNQVFHFFHLGDGVYKVMARHSKLSLTVAKMGGEYANLHNWTYHDSESQKFIVVPSGNNTFKLISMYNGMVVNAANNGLEANVRLNANQDQDLAKWIFTKTLSREGHGDGLKGEYFTGNNFASYEYTRIDPEISFNWGEASPGSPLLNDHFSIRWTGSLEPRYSGLYTFFLTSDNGRRLWINNHLVIDKWISDWDVTYTGTISLSEMTKYDIVVEYFEEAGGANIKLEWGSAHETREVIPQSQLYSEKVTSSTLNPYSQTRLSVYPNPVKNWLYVDGLENPALLEIYSMTGRKLLEVVGCEISTESLLSGLYVLSVKHEGKIDSYKFLKN